MTTDAARDVAAATEAVLSVCDPVIRQMYADAVTPDDILAWAPGALSRGGRPEPLTVQALVDAVAPLLASARARELRDAAMSLRDNDGYERVYAGILNHRADRIEAGEDPS